MHTWLSNLRWFFSASIFHLGMIQQAWPKLDGWVKIFDAEAKVIRKFNTCFIGDIEVNRRLSNNCTKRNNGGWFSWGWEKVRKNIRQSTQNPSIMNTRLSDILNGNHSLIDSYFLINIIIQIFLQCSTIILKSRKHNKLQFAIN